MFKYYNQLLEYYTRSGCSLYTLYNILQIQYWIQVDNKFIKATLKKAEKDKVRYESYWAYFAEIYQWFCDEVYYKTKVKIRIKAVDIRSKEFETLLNSWYAFWLWLKHSWLWYRNARKDKVINDNDLKNFEAWAELWHNHTYYKGIIIDSLLDNTLKMDLNILRRAVNMGIYYSTCRTLYLEDKLLEKHLKLFQQWVVVENVELLSKKEQKAIEKASRLRVFKK